MTNILTAFANFTRPGVRVVETTAGYRVLEIASFQAVYMIGSATTGNFLEPTLVRSLEDFTNQFGSSTSEAAVKLYFRNDRSGLLYFIRTPIAAEYTVTVDTAGAGTYGVDINGVEVEATAVAADTPASIASLLIQGINTSAAASAVTAVAGMTANQLLIRQDNPLGTMPTVTLDENAARMTLTTSTPIVPKAADYVYAIENTFDYEEDWAQGFLIAPQAFQLLPQATDRLAVGNAMHALAAEEGFDWVALVDCGPAVDTVAEAQTDGQQYVSPQGHTFYYAPYVTDLDDVVVPASPAIAGLATKRFKEEGFHQPIAGAKYPLQGVKDVTHRFNNQDQSVLNPLGINLVRYLRNKGVVSWAMRTRSADAFYTFGVTRVIMNVLNGTLRRGFDFDLFNSIDGQGVLLSRIEETARAVCRRMWIGKALFGNSEEDAFEVRCNFENNLSDELERGNVLLEVYAAPSPAVERILINTIRVPVGQVQSAAAAGQITAN
ncbi:phage tail sheath subtilisin-like domain-containing protein [Pseudanabaena sp. FACHB-2040]|uniref:phage tail sheath subtilisin-like domain-containing protein n=1 Tax=Pseudanabaena sp. FACHB-2040 TaxID=2692859 RepID=UPI0016832EB0|nr:phage tail sheath subtilisin-like domain-containing protein [Pseudanabaena sp. FACHB-2040]MBD2256655.1 phage tail sheath subtilisin-like domain-containing protein [Pseudanabaena sp. FACHB-2040]